MASSKVVARCPNRTKDIEAAAIEGAVHRLRPKLMTISAVLASLAPILWESSIGSDAMKTIAAPIVGGMITSPIHVLIFVPVFFVMIKETATSPQRTASRLKTVEDAAEYLSAGVSG